MLERTLELSFRDSHWRENNTEKRARGFSDHGAGRVADGTAEGTARVHQNGAAGQMPGLLADAFVGFAVLSQPHDDRRSEIGAVVEAEGPTRFNRAEIANVHHVGDAVETFSLHDAAQQRFGGWSVTRWVHAPRAEHRAHAAHGIEQCNLLDAVRAADALADGVHFRGQARVHKLHLHIAGLDEPQLNARNLNGDRHHYSQRTKSRLVLCRESGGGSKLKARSKDANVRDDFRKGVEQFNAEKFFDAHESWEAIWLHAPEPDKTFLQGITQVSAAFHHYSKGNDAGAKTLLKRGLQKLEKFPADYRGVNVEKLREEVRRWLEIIPQKITNQEEPRPKIEWA